MTTSGSTALLPDPAGERRRESQDALRFLYAEDNFQDAELTARYFAEEAPDLCLEILGFGEECHERLASEHFDGLLLDNHLPDVDGIDVLKRLRQVGHRLPVVMLTMVGDEETVARALEAGADDYVTKSQNYLATLPPLLRSLVARTRARPFVGDGLQRVTRVLLVPQRPGEGARIATLLTLIAPHLKIVIADDAAAALALLAGPDTFDVIVSELFAPGMLAQDLFRAIRERGIPIPFIVLTADGDEKTAVSLLRLGISDYLVKRERYLIQLPHSIDHALRTFNLDRTTRRLRADIEALNRSLEERIIARTSELREEIERREKVEADLRASGERYFHTLENMIEGCQILDHEFRYLYVNEAAARHGNKRKDELIGRKMAEVYPGFETTETFKALLRCMTARVPLQMDSSFLHEDKESRFELSILPVPEGAFILSIDITARHRIQADLVSSLKEKDALLKEVHHRVKNNLQIISSFIRLESRRIDHEETRGVLRDMQGRIQSMALLHETLYRTGDFSRVDLARYLGQVAAQLIRSLVTRPETLRVHTNMEAVRVDIDQAIPCGLILNELASNSVKHAFPAGQPGDVWIELGRDETSGEVALTVRDSGVGLPAGFDLLARPTLGLKLVASLAKQLQGTLNVTPGPGASFEVRFVPAAVSDDGVTLVRRQLSADRGDHRS